jgi:hypothetical protein
MPDVLLAITILTFGYWLASRNTPLTTNRYRSLQQYVKAGCSIEYP